MNARLAEDLEWGQFVTAFLAFLSPGGVLHWSSAGHGPVLVRPAVGQPMRTLDPPVQPLGVLPTWTDRSPDESRHHCPHPATCGSLSAPGGAYFLNLAWMPAKPAS